MKKLFTLTLLCLFAVISIKAQTINNLYVSPTGWVQWECEDASSSTTYQVYLNNKLVADQLTDTYYQHKGTVNGQRYKTQVVPFNAETEGTSAEYTWKKVSCDEFEGVTDLKAEFVDNEAVISWSLPLVNDRNTEAPTREEGTWMYYDNGTFAESIGLTYDAEKYEVFKWGIMFPASDMTSFAGQSMKKVSFYDCEAYDGELFIYFGGDTEPGTQVHNQKFSCSGSKDFFEITLNEEIEVSGNDNIWVILSHSNAKIPAAGCEDQGNANGRWIYFEGYPWLDNAMISIPPFTWMIRAYVEPSAQTEILGTILYRNEEVLSELVTGESYIDADAKLGDEYAVRVVYGGEKDLVHYAMSCEQSATIVSVEENNIDKAIIYPNPTSGNININAATMTHICITNALGQVVYDKDADSDNKVIDMTQYEAGVYFVSIVTDAGNIVKRITITK